MLTHTTTLRVAKIQLVGVHRKWAKKKGCFTYTQHSSFSLSHASRAPLCFVASIGSSLPRIHQRVHALLLAFPSVCARSYIRSGRASERVDNGVCV